MNDSNVEQTDQPESNSVRQKESEIPNSWDGPDAAKTTNRTQEPAKIKVKSAEKTAKMKKLKKLRKPKARK